MRNEDMTNDGITFGGALFIAFLVLKLTGAITWSWWWIFSPFWVPLAVVVAIPLAGLVAYFTSVVIDACKRKRRN